MERHAHVLKTCSDCDGVGVNRWDGLCLSCDARGYVEYCAICGEPMGNRRRKWKRERANRDSPDAQPPFAEHVTVVTHCGYA